LVTDSPAGDGKMANFYLQCIRYTMLLAKPHPSEVSAPFNHYVSVPDKKILRPRLRKRIVLLFHTVLYVSLSGYAVIDQFRSIRSNIISRLFRQLWDSAGTVVFIYSHFTAPFLSCPVLSFSILPCPHAFFSIKCPYQSLWVLSFFSSCLPTHI
jgi:hypothetical protein